MSNISKDRSLKDHTLIDRFRRKTLLSGVAFISLGICPQASFANGGGRDFSDLKIIYDDTEDVEKEDKPTFVYTQTKFTGLSQKTINNLYYKVEKNQIDFNIKGFSSRFSPLVLKMGYYDRKATRSLVRDMRKVKSKSPRKDRLKLELGYRKRYETDLKVSIKYLKSTKSPKLAGEKSRLKKSQGYKSGVRSWMRAPLEGRF